MTASWFPVNLVVVKTSSVEKEMEFEGLDPFLFGDLEKSVFVFVHIRDRVL